MNIIIMVMKTMGGTLEMLSVSKKPHKRKRSSSQNTSEHCLTSPSNIVTEISEEDLSELHTAYKKCKEVIKKIEHKYGHLLIKNNILEEESESKNACTCKFNKKIVFSDDGQQIAKDIVPDLHICPKKPHSYASNLVKNEPNIVIEHDIDYLPSDLKDLCEILKDERIDIVYRNKVIERIKSMRHDNINTMRFDRKLLIEKLKVNPDSLFEFKGANVSALPGYPVNPIQDK